MKVDRDEIVERLRGMGRHEDADRALEELPERVDVKKFAGKLHSYGLGPEPFNPNGAIGGSMGATSGGLGGPSGFGM
jgi:hypothetical protein